MVKKLIINADDFGISEAVSLGILKTYREGVVTSTTCMMNMPDIVFSLEEAKKYPDLALGVHLNLSVGHPLTDGKSFVNEEGNFYKYHGHPQYDLDEVYEEWKCQIERFIDLAGKHPTHLDSHHHIALEEDYFPVLMRLAHEYDVPVRLREPKDDRFEFAKVMDKMFNKNEIDSDIFQREEEIIEWMCHPGFVDQTIYCISSYHLPRSEEVVYFTSQDIKEKIKAQQIELINYTHLKRK